MIFFSLPLRLRARSTQSTGQTLNNPMAEAPPFNAEELGRVVTEALSNFLRSSIPPRSERDEASRPMASTTTATSSSVTTSTSTAFQVSILFSI